MSSAATWVGLPRLACFAEPGETPFDTLERLVHRLHGGMHPKPLLATADELRSIDTIGRPYATLAVALVLRERVGDVEEVEALVSACEAAFAAAGDGLGASYCAFLRGNQALVRGDLEAAGARWRAARLLAPESGWLEATAVAHLALVHYVERGDLIGADLLTEEAIALSRLRNDRRIEGVALVYGAFFAISGGHFARSDRLLDLADDVFAELPSDQRPERALVPAARAVVAALRGQHVRAEEQFSLALAAAEDEAGQWYAAMIRALRAEFTAVVDPRRALADARIAKDLCARLDDRWWWTWAERGQALAATALGQYRAAETTLRTLLDQPLNQVERGRTLLALGETQLQAGVDDASTTLKEAAAVLEASGARYFLVRSLHALSIASPRRRNRLLARAATHMEDDLAYRILRGLSMVEVEVLGPGAVRVGGVPAVFGSTKSLLLVCSLATAPSGALHWEALVDRLWPSASPDRARASLRTALWEARRALGPEAWRLERRGDLVRFERDGVAVDLLDALDEAERLATADPQDWAIAALLHRLGTPVLQAAAYDEWVVALDGARAAAVARLRASRARC
jgi:tetratricopeptide (TPR) repeat protein